MSKTVYSQQMNSSTQIGLTRYNSWAAIPICFKPFLEKLIIKLYLCMRLSRPSRMDALLKSTKILYYIDFGEFVNV